MFFLFLVGLLSILGQVALLRELTVAFYGIELAYLLAIGIWLLATATGAVAGRRRSLPSPRTVELLFLAFAAVIVLDMVFLRASRVLFSGVPGAYLPFPRQLAAMAVALLPVGFLLGLLFQLAAWIYVAGRRTLALAYAIESAGGLAGGIVATVGFRLGLQTFALSIVCALVAVAGALVRPVLARRRPARWLGLALLAGLLVLAATASSLDDEMTRWNHPGLVASRDTPYGRVTVSGTAGQISVFENDELAFESEGTAAEEFAHLAALQHPAPGRILVLGGGLEGLIAPLLQHRPQSVEYVELDRAMFDLVRPHLARDVHASLDARGVSVRFGDPRRILPNLPPADLILVSMSEPTSGQANRFYTTEFFEQAAAKLGARGVLAFRLRSAENFWMPQLARRMASIYRALRPAFRDVVVLPGATNIVLASREPLVRDPAVLASRLEARQIKARLVTPAYVRYLYTNDRRDEIERTLEQTVAPVNSDVRPICYQYAAMIWLSKFFPEAARADANQLLAGDRASRLQWFAWPGLAALFVLSRIRAPWRRAVLVGVAGLAGMVLETVLILHFQLKNGVVFQDIGVLLMAFMAGLAVGAVAVGRLAGGKAAAGSVSRPLGVAILVAFVAMSLLVAHNVTAGTGSSLISVALLLAADGVLVAAVFAYASLHSERAGGGRRLAARGQSGEGATNRMPEQTSLISPLYAADLVGGSIGSILATLVLVPLAGLDATAQWMAILLAMSLLLL